MTFEPLPREFFAQGTPLPRLTLARGKVQMLRELGVDAVGLLRFDAAMAAMQAEDLACSQVGPIPTPVSLTGSGDLTAVDLHATSWLGTRFANTARSLTTVDLDGHSRCVTGRAVGADEAPTC